MKKKILIVTILALIVYANALNNGFQYDDDIYVVNNSKIRELHNIPSFFTHPEYLTSSGHRSHYRPLLVSSYAVSYALGGGLKPWAFRIVNLLFHIGSAILLFLIVHGILGITPYSAFIALASAIIFVVHPFNSEAVNYITARSSVMSSFFYLLAFYFWIRYRKVSANSEEITGREKKMETQSPATCYLLPATYYIASLLTFLLGMLTKEIVITLPLVLWLYDVYFHRHAVIPASSLSRGKERKKDNFHVTTKGWRTYLPYIPFILVVVVPYLLIRIFYSGRMLPSFKRDMFTQLATEMPVLVKYMRLLLFPAGLNIAHDIKIYSTFFTPSVILYTIFLLFCPGLGVYLFRSRSMEWRLLSFAIFFFFITLLPTTIIPLNVILQENRGYLAGIGFAIIISIVLYRLVYTPNIDFRWAYGPLIILLIIFSVVTIQRNRVWKDGITLWSDALQKAPGNTLIHNNLGTLYQRAGMLSEAENLYLKGVELSPREWIFHYNLGNIYWKQGRLDLAIKEYEVAASLAPREPKIHNNLGFVLLRQGNLPASIEAFKKAIELKPAYARAHYNMGRALYQQGLFDMARKEFGMALRYAESSGDTGLARIVKEKLKSIE